MIRVKKVIQKYPNCSVLLDLLSRSGPPTEDTFTPFYGQRGLLVNEDSYSSADKAPRLTEEVFSRFSMDTFLKQTAEFNLSKLTKLNPTPERLEDCFAPVGSVDENEYKTRGQTSIKESTLLPGLIEVINVSMYIDNSLYWVDRSNTSPIAVRDVSTRTFSDDEGVGTEET